MLKIYNFVIVFWSKDFAFEPWAACGIQRIRPTDDTMLWKIFFLKYGLLKTLPLCSAWTLSFRRRRRKKLASRYVCSKTCRRRRFRKIRGPTEGRADGRADGRTGGRRVSRRLRASPSCAPRAPAERQRRDRRGSKVGVFSALQLYIQRRMLRNRFDIHLKVSLTAFFEPLIFSLLFCHRIGVFFFLHVQMSFQDQTFPFRLREHGNSSNQRHKSPGLPIL